MATTTPAPRRPMNTISVPTPAWMPTLSASGTSRATRSRTLDSDSARNTTPVNATIASAPCQGTPICRTSTKVKMTLEPMAGATASGRLAHSPISTVPKIAASAVAITRSPRSMPAPDMIEGLTAMMYDMAAKVVSPATTSRPTVEPRAPTWKCRSTQPVRAGPPTIESIAISLLFRQLATPVPGRPDGPPTRRLGAPRRSAR